VSLAAVDNTNSNKGGLVAGINNTGGLYATAPTPAVSSNNTSIATTAFVKSVLSGNDVGLAKFSKAQNGYYKFSNGLIIQWGTTNIPGSTTVGTSLSQTLPTPFTTENYGVTANVFAVQQAYARGHVSLNGKSTTTVIFRLSDMTYVAGGNIYWVAIGY
jgi:hypothetical protein